MVEGEVSIEGAVPEVIQTLESLPIGSHALSLHADREEARRRAAEFLRGTPSGQAASYWLPAADLIPEYDELIQRVAPEQIGCIRALTGEQVEPRGGRLRPTEDVLRFLEEHPGGVSASGETISQYWNASNLEAHLEYERWFDDQPRDGSRFLCPYDLKTIPSAHPEMVLRELGSLHSHVTLSRSQEPGVRLLQLFIFRNVRDLPDSQEPSLGWALRTELVDLAGDPYELELTSRGDDVVREWSHRTVIF